MSQMAAQNLPKRLVVKLGTSTLCDSERSARP